MLDKETTRRVMLVRIREWDVEANGCSRWFDADAPESQYRADTGGRVDCLRNMAEPAFDHG